MDDDQMELAELSTLYAMSKLEAAKENDVKFVHYTSAFAATQIIQNEEVWLRNALVMNDFSEVQHGETCLCPEMRGHEANDPVWLPYLLDLRSTTYAIG